MKLHLSDYNKLPYDSIIIRRCKTGDNLEIVATLPSGTTEWVDNNAPKDVLLNYTTCARRGPTDFQFSSYYAVRRDDNGPKVNNVLYLDSLIRGDGFRGLYGWIRGDIDFDIDRLNELYPANLEKIDNEGQQSYAKVEYEGRLIFVPRLPNALATYNDLEKAGLLRVSDTPDSIHSYPQGKIAQMGLYAYRPFIPTPEEYEDLYGNLFASTVIGQRNNRVLANAIPHDEVSLTCNTEVKDTAAIHYLDGTIVDVSKDILTNTLICWEYVPYALSMEPIRIIYNKTATIIQPAFEMEFS